jgi:hypothetical protein
MTETEWLACLTDERSRRAGEVLQRYANGQAGPEEVRAAARAAAGVIVLHNQIPDRHGRTQVLWMPNGGASLIPERPFTWTVPG